MGMGTVAPPWLSDDGNGGSGGRGGGGGGGGEVVCTRAIDSPNVVTGLLLSSRWQGMAAVAVVATSPGGSGLGILEWGDSGCWSSRSWSLVVAGAVARPPPLLLLLAVLLLRSRRIGLLCSSPRSR